MFEQPLDEVNRISFILSIMLLFTAFPLTIQLLYRIYQTREKCHVLQLAMGWLLIGDLFLICNFGLHHSVSFASGYFWDGPYCIASGFWSMVMVVFSNMAAAGCAIVTNKSMGMHSRQFATQFRTHLPMITAFMFIPGLIYASVLAGTSHVGNYRDLYCCMVDNGNPWVVWGGFLIFATCVMVQGHQYYQSYAYVKRQLNKTTSRTEDNEITKAKFVAGIRDHALRMCALFYIAWLPMMVTAIIAYFHGGVVNADGKEAFAREVDVFVVLCAKVVPLLDCFVIKRSLDKSSSNASGGVSQIKDQPRVTSPSKMSKGKSQNAQTVKSPTKDQPADMSETTGSKSTASEVPDVNITFKAEKDPDEDFHASYADHGIPEPPTENAPMLEKAEDANLRSPTADPLPEMRGVPEETEGVEHENLQLA